MKSVIDILEAELLGKILRVKTSDPVTESYQVDVKKSASVTDKQFESGDKKYRMVSTRKRTTGNIETTKESEIVRISLYCAFDEVHIQINTADGLSELYHDHADIDYFEKPL